ncbi:MAG: flagellar basal body P-ring formation protein FlgA [Candidatus Marinimicrobia bacterium]|nr:flagellar basal body P-ring formation protein FlgA [Candidatus Neomarinimicrobiota bacterium]
MSARNTLIRFPEPLIAVVALLIGLPGFVMPAANSPKQLTFEERLEAVVVDEVNTGLRREGLTGELVALNLPANLPDYSPSSEIKVMRQFVPSKAAGRWVLPVEVTPPGGKSVKVNITLETMALIHVWEAIMPVKRGDPLDEENFRRKLIRVNRRERDYYTENDFPGRYQLNHSISAGQSLHHHHIKKEPAVHRGEAVMIHYQRNNLALIMPGKARRDGQIGDVIPVIAGSTGKRIYGRLDAPGVVIVE